MRKSDNIFWARTVVPNLPPQYLSEYMFLLGEYCECPFTSARPSHLGPQICSSNSNKLGWVFPFLDVEDSFDNGEFEKWVEMVEQDMMKRYSLTEHHFCS